MDDDYLYDAYAGRKKDFITKAAFATKFLKCSGCKPNVGLQALTDKSEASRSGIHRGCPMLRKGAE
jgi:hypothetical protein